MLEANPELSYRDVQEILIRSSRQASLQKYAGHYANAAEGWQTNMYEPWQSPAFTLVPADPEDPEAGMKVVPIEDPFNRIDIIGLDSTTLDGEPVEPSTRNLDGVRT